VQSIVSAAVIQHASGLDLLSGCGEQPGPLLMQLGHAAGPGLKLAGVLHIANSTLERY
jgi:hypothetical protein